MYSVNFLTKVVTITKADTVLVSSSPDVRSLDVTTLWQTLVDIQDDVGSMTYPDIVSNIPPFTVAGTTFARVVQIINGYTLTFEDGPYAVNIVGGNSNAADVNNKNQVSVNTANSAGFVQAAGDTAVNIATEVMAQLVETGLSVKAALRLMTSVLNGKLSGAPGSTITFRNAVADTKDRVVATVDGVGNRTSITYDSSD